MQYVAFYCSDSLSSQLYLLNKHFILPWDDIKDQFNDLSVFQASTESFSSDAFFSLYYQNCYLFFGFYEFRIVPFDDWPNIYKVLEYDRSLEVDIFELWIRTNALVYASTIGNLKFIKQDPRVNPGDREDEALFKACENNHPDIGEYLMTDTRVDPSSMDNRSVLECYNGFTKVLELLLRNERVDPVLMTMYPFTGLLKVGMMKWFEFCWNPVK